MQGHDDEKHGNDLLRPLSCKNGEDVQDDPHPVGISFLPDPKFPEIP